MQSNVAASIAPSTDPDRFKSVIRDELFPIHFHSELNSLKTASLGGFQTGVVDVLRYVGQGLQWGDRSPDQIRSDRADYYAVCVPISARLDVSQNGLNARLRPGQFAFVSTRRPFEAQIRPLGDEPGFSALHVRVAGSLLRSRIPNVDDICNHELELRPGATRMMLSLFDIALTDGAYLSEPVKNQFGVTLLNAIADVALSVSDKAVRRDRESTQQRTLKLAKAYIATHLSDAELNPAMIADYCGVSVRSLHAAFATLSIETVNGFIRESRLLECRSALQNPRISNRTIIQIAGDWGFDDPSHFCHVYKSRFGNTPREERRHLLASAERL